MKYFITGGAGFIGREIVKQILQNKKNKVLIYDDFSFGNKNNIQEFKTNPNLQIIKGDILNFKKIENNLISYNPQIVIHLAAIHFIPLCEKFPQKTMDINVQASFHLMNICTKLTGLKKILFASSGAIYKSELSELQEDINTPEPTDNYGISKFLGEQICQFFSKKITSKIMILRFFNTFGPYETNEHLIPEIIKQLKKSNTLQLGNIHTKRDYIFTEDIANAVVKLSICKQNNPLEVINIGSNKEYSAEELVQVISKLLGKKIEIKINPNRLRKSDKPHQIASHIKINQFIKWRPKYTIETGLKKLLQHEGLM